MTEHEFRNLNIGDEIWVVKDYSESLVEKGSVSEVSIDGLACRSVYIKGDPSSHKYCNVFKTEVEAYQNCLDKNEWFLKQANHNLEELTIKRDKSRVALVRAKKRADHDTEQEAYEALTKFYERKLFKALEKCGYKFAIPYNDKWIIPMLVRAEEEEVWRVSYYPSQAYGCVRKQDLFDTFEEAKAELERRKAK